MTEGFSPARILYSDRDSPKMKGWRAIELAGGIAFAVGALAFYSAFVLVIAMGTLPQDPLARLATLGLWAAFLVLLYALHVHMFLSGPLDAVRHGVFVTSTQVHYRGSTIPVPATLRAELVRLAGYGDRLMIDYAQTRFGRRHAATMAISRSRTESLARLRDAVRDAAGLPPQTLVEDSTPHEWRRTAKAQLRGSTP